jgi:huntingtin
LTKIQVFSKNPDFLGNYKNTRLFDNTCSNAHFLVQILVKYFLYLEYMFHCGSFRRLTRCFVDLIEENLHADDEDKPDEEPYWLSVETLNEAALNTSQRFPLLTLHWMNVLMLLDGVHRGKLLRARAESASAAGGGAPDETQPSPCAIPGSGLSGLDLTQTLLSRAALVLLCDHFCENYKDAEKMTWLIVESIADIVYSHSEVSVRDLLDSINRNAAASGLFIQAVNSRIDQRLVTSPTFALKIVDCVHSIHASKFHILLSLLTEKVLTNPAIRGFHSVTANTELLLVRKIDEILSDETMLLEVSRQLTSDDLRNTLAKLEASSGSTQS